MVHRRMLVVEDHDASRNAMVRIFRVKGYKVTEAATVAEAMALLYPPPFGIVLDLMLPDGPGEAILHRVRASNLPSRVTVCTASHDGSRLATIRLLNPQAVLFKPIDLEDVVTACEKRRPVSPPAAAGERTAQTTHPNRRRLERAPFFTRVSVASLPRGFVFEARSMDINLDGVGLVCQSSLPVGQLVTLTFLFGTTGKRLDETPVCGRVAHVRFNDGAAILGIEFIPSLNRWTAPALIRVIEGL